MSEAIQARTIAMAGVLQSAELVRQIAQTGQCSQTAWQASIGSIFQTNPANVEAIFGGLDGIKLGCRMLTETLGMRVQSTDLQTLHYAIALIKLSTRIMRQPKRQRALGEAIELTRGAWNTSEEPMDPSIAAQLADTYQRHISTMSFRIRVHGTPTILKSQDKVAMIRALLLAGVRSGFLWRQLGGNQWRLLMERRAMVKYAQRLI